MLEVETQARAERTQSRRALLRVATEELHRKLDARFTPTDFTERTAYARFLERTARALLPLERALDRSVVSKQFVDWPTRRRSDALSQDLHELGIHRTDDSGVRQVELEPAQAFGALYVLEGSRLGSKVLLGFTQSSKDQTVRSATRYLSANDAILWRTYLSTLEDETIELRDSDLIRGARFAFECYLEAYAAD